MAKKCAKEKVLYIQYTEGKIRRGEILQSALVERGDELIMHKRILLFTARVFLETQGCNKVRVAA